MKAYFTISCLLAINTIIANPAKQVEAYLTEDETAPLFQRYLTTCCKHNMVNQPVYLRNACREKEPTFTEMTILDAPSIMQIEAVAERVLYGDADVVHLADISSQKASCLYEMLQDTYSHFIHVPRKDRGEFIASKYPLSQVEITQYEQENAMREEVLEFAIHGANMHRACLSLNDSSIRLVNSNDSAETAVLFGDLPVALTVVKQHFSPFQNAQNIDLIAKDTFNIVPVRRGEGGRDNNDRSGPYCEGSIDFKNGPNGTEWSVSARGGYEDDKGNYVEGQVSRNDKGETSGSARAGHDQDK
jgi:hypothetical protein